MPTNEATLAEQPRAETISALIPGSVSLVRYLMLAFQLGLFILLLWRFNLESRAFLHLSILTLFGWSIHYFLPQRLRLPFFVLLSLVGIVVVFGFQQEQWSIHGVMQGVWIIVIGIGLISVCHLPIKYSWRIALLLFITAILAAARGGAIDVPWSGAIWPILGAMFMFRLIVYVLQIRHDKKPATPSETLAYFFMLPNVCFPLFPVVDYLTFRRTYYDNSDRHQIYQTGMLWMFRGIFQLMLYRLIYQNLVIGAEEVENTADLIRYLIWPFLLYLRVSGTFHVITGMLHLFGFNLTETHKLYYLSSSFTDFWRRINIYWKDFIMTTFYYPVFFKMRRFGGTAAVLVATMFGFVMTWLLHAYQWYWLRGTWLLTWNDFLFWALLSLLVVANSLYEIKNGRKRRLRGKALTWRETLSLVLRTIGVFISISVMWSFWSANSVEEWLAAWGALTRPGGSGLEAILLLMLVVAGIGFPAAFVARGLQDRPYSFSRSVVAVVLPALLLLAISVPEIRKPMGINVRKAVRSLQSSELNNRDFAKLERGYYENLFNVGGFNSELWEVYRTKPADWTLLIETDIVQFTDGLPFFELRPSHETLNKGATIRTNRWGMRDREYAKARPAGTFRIALVGASFVFGTGVENHETFESSLEDMLDSKAGKPTPGGHYEILNFAVAGYSAIERLAVVDKRVFEFEPDHILYVEHRDAADSLIPKVAKLLKERTRHPYKFVNDIARKAGIDVEAVNESSDEYLMITKLAPFKEELLRKVYAALAESGRERGVPVVWAYLPRPEEFDQQGPSTLELRLAREAGFTIIDLSGVYDEHDLKSLWIARWDHHPNAFGHQLIAEKLYRELVIAQVLKSQAATR